MPWEPSTPATQLHAASCLHQEPRESGVRSCLRPPLISQSGWMFLALLPSPIRGKQGCSERTAAPPAPASCPGPTLPISLCSLYWFSCTQSWGRGAHQGQLFQMLDVLIRMQQGPASTSQTLSSHPCLSPLDGEGWRVAIATTRDEKSRVICEDTMGEALIVLCSQQDPSSHSDPSP